MRDFCRIAALLLTAGVLTASASAQITPIGPFTGDNQEGFETQIRGQFLPSYDVFDDTAVVQKLGSGGQGLHITTSWGFFCTVRPRSGQVFMGATGNLSANWIFDVPAKRFGGYFSTNADVPGATAEFYDEDDNLMATKPVASPKCEWQWDGWETSGPGIKRVVIIAKNRFNCHIMHDDMEYSAGGGGECDPCDANCDGSVDLTDVEPFIELLIGEGKPCDTCSGDTNDDGSVDLTDVEGFLECLLG